MTGPPPPVPPGAPPVSVLIATRNRRGDLLETLAAVAALAYPPAAVEVLVLDNESDDGTEGALRQWIAGPGRAFARAEGLRAPRNLGAAGARNALAARAAAGSRYLFVLDDDAVPEPALLATLVQTLEADPGLGMAGARIVAWDEPGRELAGAGFIDWRWGRFREVRAPAALDCDFVVTCAAVIRAEAFRAAGGFDDEYFVYHEDVDFCVRLRRAGFRVRYEPRVAARHKVAPGKARTPERLYYLVRNKLLFLRKHLPPARHPLAWLAHGATLVPRMAAQSLRHRGARGAELRAIVRAGWDGLRGRAGPWSR